MAWFSLAKIAMQAGAKIYSNRQKTKMAMSDAQLMHAEKMARGEESYQGKLLEARQNDYKDEFVLVIISAPIVVLMWAVMSDDPTAMEKVKLFFEYFHELPKWFTNLWVLVVASIFGIKGTQIFRNGGKKIMANPRFNKQVTNSRKALKGGGMGGRTGDMMYSRGQGVNMRSKRMPTELMDRGAMKKGGKVGKKKQGYKARKDESIAMRIKKKRTKKQLKASRDDSYGRFGSKAKNLAK